MREGGSGLRSQLCWISNCSWAASLGSGGGEVGEPTQCLRPGNHLRGQPLHGGEQVVDGVDDVDAGALCVVAGPVVRQQLVG